LKIGAKLLFCLARNVRVLKKCAEESTLAGGAMHCSKQHLYSIIASARLSKLRGFKSEHISGLEVDDQFEFCHPLHRQVGRAAMKWCN
jgi:hypothetical protein